MESLKLPRNPEWNITLCACLWISPCLSQCFSTGLFKRKNQEHQNIREHIKNIPSVDKGDQCLSFIPVTPMVEGEKTPASCPLARIQNKQVVIFFKKGVFSDLIPKPMGIRGLRGQPAICVCTTPIRQFWYTKEKFEKRLAHVSTSCLPAREWHLMGQQDAPRVQTCLAFTL